MQIKKYLRGDGRASRTEYWAIQIGASGVFAVIADGVIAIIIALMESDHGGVSGGAVVYLVLGTSTLLALVLVLLMLLFIWVLLAVSVRRLHDCNIPGWPALILLVPYFGPCFLISLGVLPPNKSER